MVLSLRVAGEFHNSAQAIDNTCSVMGNTAGEMQNADPPWGSAF